MPSHRLHVAAAALFLLAAAGAQAQYVWIEPNGTRQYSDRPPPPGTPASRILKSPGRTLLLPAPAEDAAPDAKPATKPAPTLAERDAAYRERVKTRGEQERKDEDAARNGRALAERCETARQNMAALASGTRIAQYGADGERRYLSDEEKAERMARANRALRDCR
jgi:hypothetical protein